MQVSINEKLPQNMRIKKKNTTKIRLINKRAFFITKKVLQSAFIKKDKKRKNWQRSFLLCRVLFLALKKHDLENCSCCLLLRAQNFRILFRSSAGRIATVLSSPLRFSPLTPRSKKFKEGISQPPTLRFLLEMCIYLIKRQNIKLLTFLFFW